MPFVIYSLFFFVQSSSLVLWHCSWHPSPWLRSLLCSTTSLKYDLMLRNLWRSCEDQWQQEPKTLVGCIQTYCSLLPAFLKCIRFAACSCLCLHISADNLASTSMRNYEQRLLDTYTSLGYTFFVDIVGYRHISTFLWPPQYCVSVAYQ